MIYREHKRYTVQTYRIKDFDVKLESIRTFLFKSRTYIKLGFDRFKFHELRSQLNNTFNYDRDFIVFCHILINTLKQTTCFN